jgi:protein-S-isoprenylcysteine O-methyltransferase Ste14
MTPRTLALVAVLVSWVVLGVLLVGARIRAGRGGVAGGATRARDLASWGGLVLQSIAFAIAFNARRDPGAPLVPGLPPAADWFLAALAVLLAVGSTAFGGWALRTLDKQWSLTARVREDHALVTAGPFAHVRHPVYSALLGLLVATGMALADWRALALAIVVYLAGTLWRASREERLLREAFGPAYASYAARVPRLLPRFTRGADTRWSAPP